MDKYAYYNIKENLSLYNIEPNNSCNKIINYGNMLNNVVSALSTPELSKLLILLDILGKAGYSINRSNILTLISIILDQSKNDLVNGVIARYSTSSQGPIIQSMMSKLISDNILKPEELAKNTTPKKNPLIEAFMKDILDKKASDSFRGWLLPNGELLSQYTDTTSGESIRQDHSKIVELFINGLETYSPENYAKIKTLYKNYQQATMVGNAYESFAVEVLGWIQISHFGRMRLVYRGERWQDNIVRPFLVDYGFSYVISNNAVCCYDEFSDLFDHIGEIIELGLGKRYSR